MPRVRSWLILATVIAALTGCGRWGFGGDGADGGQNGDAAVNDAAVNDAATLANRAPTIDWNLRPSATTPGQTVVLDGSNVMDDQTAAADLEVRFDFDNDGTWDTAFSTDKLAMTSYASPGLYHVTAQVRDPQGLTTVQTRQVVIANPADLLIVTTWMDENDPGATPGNPMGAGFSLREAINVANGQAGHQTIWLSNNWIIELSSGLPVITDSVDLVGFQEFGALSGIRGDAVPAGQPCISVQADDSRFVFWKIIGCPEESALVVGNNSEFHNCLIEGSNVGVQFDGTGHQVTDTDFAGFFMSTAVSIVSGDATFERIGFQGCTTAIAVNGGSGTNIRGSLLVQNDTALSIDAGASDVVVRNNTFWNNGTAAIDIASGSTGNQVHNNLFSTNPISVSAAPASLTLDYNSWWASSTNCSGCTIGANAVTSDPLLTDPANRDFELRETSAAVNAGTDLGDDRNGPEPGLFWGSAPDIGAVESRY